MWDIADLVIKNSYVFVLAITLALLEIEIEGPNGWAANLPTWRPNKDKWYTRLYASIFSDKELTGYHVTVFIFVFLIFHLPFIFGVALNWDTWLRTMFLYMNFIILWDFLWFVLNPAFTIKKFNSRNVTWHKKWFWIMPVDYYDNIVMSLVLVGILSFVNKSNEPFLWGLTNLVLFAVLLTVLILVTLVVLQTPKWKMSSNNFSKRNKKLK